MVVIPVFQTLSTKIPNEDFMYAALNNINLSSVQLLSCVQLSVTPWTAAPQASLSFIISQSLLKLMSIESLMPSNHLASPLPPDFSLSQHQGLF